VYPPRTDFDYRLVDFNAFTAPKNFRKVWQQIPSFKDLIEVWKALRKLQEQDRKRKKDKKELQEKELWTEKITQLWGEGLVEEQQNSQDWKDWEKKQQQIFLWGSKGIKDLRFRQGKMGNCFFLAAMKSLSLGEPETLKQIIHFSEDSKHIEVHVNKHMLTAERMVGLGKKFPFTEKNWEHGTFDPNAGIIRVSQSDVKAWVSYLTSQRHSGCFAWEYYAKTDAFALIILDRILMLFYPRKEQLVNEKKQPVLQRQSSFNEKSPHSEGRGELFSKSWSSNERIVTSVYMIPCAVVQASFPDMLDKILPKFLQIHPNLPVCTGSEHALSVVCTGEKEIQVINPWHALKENAEELLTDNPDDNPNSLTWKYAKDEKGNSRIYIFSRSLLDDKDMLNELAKQSSVIPKKTSLEEMGEYLYFNHFLESDKYREKIHTLAEKEKEFRNSLAPLIVWGLKKELQSLVPSATNGRSVLWLLGDDDRKELARHYEKDSEEVKDARRKFILHLCEETIKSKKGELLDLFPNLCSNVSVFGILAFRDREFLEDAETIKKIVNASRYAPNFRQRLLSVGMINDEIFDLIEEPVNAFRKKVIIHLCKLACDLASQKKEHEKPEALIDLFAKETAFDVFLTGALRSSDPFQAKEVKTVIEGAKYASDNQHDTTFASKLILSLCDLEKNGEPAMHLLFAKHGIWKDLEDSFSLTNKGWGKVFGSKILRKRSEK
jgi:hypothetical protein